MLEFRTFSPVGRTRNSLPLERIGVDTALSTKGQVVPRKSIFPHAISDALRPSVISNGHREETNADTNGLFRCSAQVVANKMVGPISIRTRRFIAKLSSLLDQEAMT